MNPTLRLGAQGPEVVRLQNALNSRPPSAFPALKPDGIFGQKTLARVKEFQSANGLVVDGVVGQNTWAKLPAGGSQIVTPARVNCSTGDPTSQAMVARIADEFVRAFASTTAAKPSFQTSKPPLAFAAKMPGVQTASLSFSPSTPFRSLTPAQEATARATYGSSIDFSKVFISDKTGAFGRPFTAAIPIPLSGIVQVMNMGTFTPATNDLIHELAHVWQSQHASNAFEFMKNSVKCQGAAVAANGAAALTDPSVRSHPDFTQGHFPTSAYAFVRGKSFSDYAAEQIANQVEKGVAAIVSHVKGVTGVDPANDASLTKTLFDDRRIAGVEI